MAKGDVFFVTRDIGPLGNTGGGPSNVHLRRGDWLTDGGDGLFHVLDYVIKQGDVPKDARKKM